MSGRGGFKRMMFVTTAAAVPVLVIAACTIQLRGDSDGRPAGSSASRVTNPLGAELERCLHQLQARGIDLQAEEPAAAEDADRQQERVRALRPTGP